MLVEDVLLSTVEKIKDTGYYRELKTLLIEQRAHSAVILALLQLRVHKLVYRHSPTSWMPITLLILLLRVQSEATLQI